MKNEWLAVIAYVEDTLGIYPKLDPWVGQKTLPLYLREEYDFAATTILALPCLLMIDREGERKTPAKIAKDAAALGGRWDGGIAYVSMALSSVDRARLVAAKLPFIVPGRQLYLPTLGVDFRELFARKAEAQDRLGPAAQVLILAALLSRVNLPSTPTEMARFFGYSKMTMGRALTELEAAGLTDGRNAGKERLARFARQGRELWEAALPRLASPVRRSLRVDATVVTSLGLLQAAETALAGYSMLAPPDFATYAVYARADGIGRLEESRVDDLDDEENRPVIELWRYDPKLLSGADKVDALSLFLALRDQEDERVQQALDAMMEGFQW